jgi:uncharacterized protein (TIGR02266 family)
MTIAERRSGKRVMAGIEIKVVQNEDYLISYSKNISAEGMFIRTDNPPPKGDIINLKFTFASYDPISVYAEVVWVNTNASTDDGIGIKFIDPPEHIRTAILKIVNRIALL